GGGWTSLFHSDRHLLENNLEKAGEQIARSFPELEDEWTKRKKRGLNKGEPLVGTNETITGFWRERRIADWTIEEYKHEVDAFVVETSTEDWHIAHALWVNNSSFRANDYLNKAKPAEGELLKGGDVGKGFLLDLQPIAALDGKDLYIIAITFSNTANWKDKLPFFGLNDPIGEATYLSVTGAADQRVKAVQTINLPSYLIERRVRLGRVLWRSRPIVFAFPATKSDGTPLIDNLDDDIELHSAIEGHDVRVRFHLRDLLVSDVSELKLKLSSSTN
ncbi:MAG TPA: hypothetical protein VJ837_00080, partial [Candidatus Paceibacterota bacterium]|nr:hypothetical protein [Candidatus Paceibacterota bacterium]